MGYNPQPVAIYQMSAGNPYQITYISSQIWSMTGYQPEDCQSIPNFWSATALLGDKIAVENKIQEAMVKKEPFQLTYCLITKEGQPVMVHLEGLPDKKSGVSSLNYQGILNIINQNESSEEGFHQTALALERLLADRTAELARANEALRGQENFALRLSETVPDLIFIYNLKNRHFDYINRLLPSLCYSLDDLNALAPTLFQKIIHPDDLSLQAERIKKIKTLKDGEIVKFDYRVHCPDSNWRNISLGMAGYAFASDGHPTQLIGIAQDITELLNSEQKNRQNTARAEALTRLAFRLNATLKKDAVIQAVCDEISRVLDLPAAGITLYNQDNSSFYLAGYLGLPADFGGRVPAIPETALVDWLKPGDRSAFIVDLNTNSNYPDRDHYINAHVHRMGIAPMVQDDELIGFLCAMVMDDHRALNDEELILLKGMADQAALAISHALQIEESERRAVEFSTLYQISVDLAEQHNLPAIYQLIVERSMKLLRASSAAVYLYDLRQKDLETVCSRGAAVTLHSRTQMGEGVIGGAAMTGKLMVVNDYSEHIRKFPHPRKLPVQAMVAAPMLYGGDLVGVIAVFEEADKQHQFRESDGHLLMLLAGQLASAVHNMRLFEEATERAAQLTLLYDSGLALNSVLEPKAQLEFLLKIAKEALHADRVAFYRFIDIQGEYRFEFGLGYQEQILEALKHLKIRTNDDYNLVAWVGKSRLPVNVPDAYLDPRYIAVDPAVRSMLLVSVEHENHLLGVLAMSAERQNNFNPQEERLLNLYANEVAVALENARLFNEARDHLKRSQSLRTINQSISASFDLRSTLNVVLDQFITQLGVDAADVLLVNPYTQTLNYTTGRGFRTAALQQTHLKIGSGLAGKAAYERRILMIPDLASESDWLSKSPRLGAEGFVSYYAVPFLSKGLVKGVLEIFSRTLMTPDREWLEFLESLERQLAIATGNSIMFDDLQRSNIEVIEAYDATLEGWLRALDLRDKETQGHTRQVVDKTLLMAKALSFSREGLVHIRRGALLHDFGKIGIPDSILSKTGPLTEAEWVVMRNHPIYAYNMIYPIAYLRPALDIPYCHHEKWDGSGYPRGIKGKLIPQAARIFAVVDVWEALSTPRIYRPEPWPEDKIKQYLIDQTGKHFDPEMVEVFFSILPGINSQDEKSAQSQQGAADL